MGIEQTFITRGREQRRLTSYQPTKHFSGCDTERYNSIAGPIKEGAGDFFTAGATREPRISRKENGNPLDHEDFSLIVVCENGRDRG